MIISSTARLRFISIPPRKMRRVVELVKGLPVEKALGILNFTPKVAALPLAKTVKSAAANAMAKENSDRLRPESLIIKNIQIDEGPSAKRIRYQSMGRVFRYKKRYCHVMVQVEGKLEAPKARTAAKAKPATAKAAAESTVDDKSQTKRKTKKTDAE